MGNLFSRTIIRDPGGDVPVRTVTGITPTNGSPLLVEPGTVACFVCNGEISDFYPPGRHILNTGLSPFFLKLRNWKTGGDPGMSACAFFLSTQQEYCTGFQSGDISFREKNFHLALKAQCEVSMRYRVISPSRFLTRVVGLNQSAVSAADLNLRLQQMILPQLRAQLGKRLAHRDITDMTADLHSLSREITSAVAPELKAYGLQIRLSILSLQIPDEQLQRVTSLEAEQVQTRLRIALEKLHIKDIYGELENRTRVELLTGVSRLPPLPGQAPPPPTGSSTASLLAGTPIQMAMLQQLLAPLLGGMGLSPGSAVPSLPPDIFSLAGTPAPQYPAPVPRPVPAAPPPLPAPRRGGD